jgi:hypothetical protein
MKSEFNDIAYRLRYEVNHFEDFGLDWSEDIEIIKFDDLWKCEVTDEEKFEHPNPIIFKGYWEVIRHIDFPYNSIFWSVMSRKMYETLLSVGNFPHRLVPMVVIDWQVQPWDWFEESTITRENAYKLEQSEWYKMGKRLKKDIIHDGFVLVQLTEHSDILDYENSVIKYDEDEPSEIRNIEEYVFNVPAEGLPPIFIVKDYIYEFFISKEARFALKKAGITGTEYTSLSGFPIEGEPTVDVPIVLPD